MLAYASSGELVDPDERARRGASRSASAGVRALKLRFHHADWREDVDGRRARARRRRRRLRADGGRQPGLAHAGRSRGRWDVATAARCARALERLGAYWLEEPLRCDDVEGYRALRRADRHPHRRRRDGARRARGARPRRCAAASTCCSPTSCSRAASRGCRRLAALADLCGRTCSARTRGRTATASSATCTSTLGVSTCPFVEVPYDPPAWSAERRDWLLPAVVEIAADGTIAPPPGPGLGVTPDLDALERWRVA